VCGYFLGMVGGGWHRSRVRVVRVLSGRIASTASRTSSSMVPTQLHSWSTLSPRRRNSSSVALSSATSWRVNNSGELFRTPSLIQNVVRMDQRVRYVLCLALFLRVGAYHVNCWIFQLPAFLGDVYPFPSLIRFSVPKPPSPP